MTDSFPGSFVDLLKTRLDALVPEHVVLGRPLRTVDPHQTIGVFSAEWQPVMDSHEIGGPGVRGEPTLARYTVMVQNMVKSADEEKGRALVSANSKIIQAVLYRDNTLHVSLRQLSETVLDRTERFKRMGIGRQRYAANDLRTGWVFLTSTYVWFETQSS